MVNGYQLKGTIEQFDGFVIVADVGGDTQLLYKHAISTLGLGGGYTVPR